MLTDVPGHLIPILDTLIAPREPAPVREPPRRDGVLEVGSIAFDVYGTLLTSAAGEISTDDERPAVHQMVCDELGLDPDDASRIVAALSAEIVHEHRRGRAAWSRLPAEQQERLLQPEVDIRTVWRRALRLVGAERFPGLIDLPQERIERAALAHELTANPVWTMPGATETLDDLSRRGFRCAIVSNAQFYTEVVLAYLIGVERLRRITPQVWSYEEGIAKPSPALYDTLLARLGDGNGAERPDSVAFVGNDMLNDVWAASRCGIRTILFAGDGSSLRTRDGDPRVAAIRPDAIVTSLAELSSTLRYETSERPGDRP